MNSNSPEQTPSAEAPPDQGISLPESDPGYFYDPRVSAGQHGEIRLSPRVDAHCRCGGRSPYQIHERPDAEPIWCPCRFYRLQIVKVNRLIAASGIPERFRYRYMDDFLERYDGKAIAGASRLKEYLRPIVYYHAHEARRSGGSARGASPSHAASPTDAPPPKGFFLWGAPGTGKTFFSYIALNELIFHSARPGKFIGLSQKFFQTLRHTFDEDSSIHGQAMQIIERLSTVPYLVIDDFGVQRNTEWELEMLYNLIDARYADQRLTLVTTNQDPEEIKGLAEGRIHSRILEMCRIIHIVSEDFREHFRREDEV